MPLFDYVVVSSTYFFGELDQLVKQRFEVLFFFFNFLDDQTRGR